MTKSAAVIGAGIGGLATALALHRAGWKVSVRERWPEVVGVGTALGLWPEAQQALISLGLRATVDEQTIPYRDALIRTPAGRTLTALPLARIERTGGAPVRMIARPTLVEALRTALPPGLISTSSPVADPEELRADHDLVVGADGFRSVVRSAYFPGSDVRYLGFVAMRGVTGHEQQGPYGEVWGRGIIAGVTPMEPGRTNWYCALRLPAGTRLDLDELRERLAGWPEPIGAALAATDPDTLLRHDVYDLDHPLRSYVHGNVALIGDAAHVMAPTLGQGACQALIDAAALADCLADDRPVADALVTYDRARRRPTQRLARASRLFGRVMLASGMGGVRNAAIRASAPFAG
jgi:2-polyprenyl-6-methoxyphenol hydroxylase-like FAD-dependent oxidoreductase